MAEARTGDPAALARAEVALSRAFARYVIDLRRPAPDAEMLFADPAAAPPEPTVGGVLAELSGPGDVSERLAAARRMNPIYAAYRQALAEHRARGGPARQERLLRLNLERARALPSELGERYVLVDAAAQRLWFYENGAAVDSMPVAVGKPSQATPIMAGLIRYVVFDPYWNLPPDLVPDKVARPALRSGPQFVEDAGFELLSGWTPQAQEIDPRQVDWVAVAAGRQELRVRQRPGPNNMMGQVKVMFPNELGVYLHDTPHRGVFAGDRRAVSAGCVRLEDAPRLVRRLLGGEPPPTASPSPERRVDLLRPVPVYLVYFTLGLEPDGRLAERPDIYRRDRALMAALKIEGSS